MSKILIINPMGTSSFKKPTKQSKKRSNMAKRSKASRRRSALKGLRRKKGRRKNPTRHRPVVLRVGRGKKARLVRVKKWRLGSKKGVRKGRKRVNPSRRRRRNPSRYVRTAKKLFSTTRMTKAILILGGLGGAGVLKAMSAKMIPEGNMREWYQRLYGVLAIAVGATINMKAPRKFKGAGTGMVVFGLYDLITSNVEQLRAYLPSISPPSAFDSAPVALPEEVEGYSDYGQDTYASMMGASIGRGGVEIVNGNLTAGEMPEIVGEDIDLADALDMGI